MIRSNRRLRSAGLGAAMMLWLVVSATCNDADKARRAEQPGGQSGRAGQPGAAGPAATQPGAASQPMTLTSAVFSAGQRVPRKNTGERAPGQGSDMSPPLNWAGLPAGAKELALIMEDPDAPRPDAPAPTPWVHWLIYKIPVEATGLPEGLPQLERLEKWIPLANGGKGDALQGRSSRRPPGNVGYHGPVPPIGSGQHRYFFRLYALDAALDLKPGITRNELLARMKGHVLATAELMGTYERK